jgi:hypothetical protein
MRFNSPLPAIILTTMAIFLTSCSRNPVAPSVGPSAGPGAGAVAVVVPEDPAPPADGGTPQTRVFSLTASDGGDFVVGRWTLSIRKNSLTMPATITLHVSDPEAMIVQIDVQPAAANVFKQPVILTANTSDIAGFDYSSGWMSIWSGGAWQSAGSVSSHPNQQDVVGHFTSLTETQVDNSGGGKKGKLGA